MEEAYETESVHFIGLDLSTQQLKATVINSFMNIVLEVAVHFDSDLPEFRTNGGVHKFDDKMRVTTPTIMWVKAMDILLEKLKLNGLDLQTVAAISGAAQQHGSVYWKKGARSKIQHLSADKFLHEQLQGSFSIPDSPVWMDSSTSEQCKNLENFMGGKEVLSNITGSRALERFTGNQIAKMFITKPESFVITERISLVSSFVASLLIGDYAPIDFSDGSGMNLLDIRSKEWCEDCLHACAPDLKEKLGPTVHSSSVLGPISPYYVDRYGFSCDCKVVAFTGDNPASLAGMGLKEKEMAISMGTSDTLFIWLDQPKPTIHGNVFVNPIDSEAYMGLLCFKNGSLTRQRICDSSAEGSWELFLELLNSTPRGNFGNIGMFFDCMEIIPAVQGEFRFNKNNDQVSRFSKEVEVRALIEGQCLAKRVHAEDMGYKIGSRVLATGGTTNNLGILQILADVFNAPVYVQDSPNAASLGSAYRAKHALLEPKISYSELFQNDDRFTLAAEPARDAEEVYKVMVSRYRKLEKSLLKQLNENENTHSIS